MCTCVHQLPKWRWKIFFATCLIASGIAVLSLGRVRRRTKTAGDAELLPLLPILVEKASETPSVLLPFHNVTLPFETVLHKLWYQDLETFLSNLSTDTVPIVSAGEDFLSLLLNWLCNFRLATSSALSEVLIVALDADIHETLLDKGFNSLFINNEDIFIPDTKLEHANLSAVWMKRVTVARIINHLGYHVTMIDLNAIVLKDIMSLYRKYSSSDVIGSIGSNPIPLLHKWGFTICLGAVFFRSTDGTEKFWNAIAKLGKDEQDDQDRVNHVLENLRINWTQDEECVHAVAKGHPTQWCSFEGKASEGFAITVLSQKMICRHGCDFKHKLHTYYIWHYYNKEQKIASTGPAWRLKGNWRKMFEKSVVKREQLIDEITDLTRKNNIWIKKPK